MPYKLSRTVLANHPENPEAKGSGGKRSTRDELGGDASDNAFLVSTFRPPHNVYNDPDYAILLIYAACCCVRVSDGAFALLPELPCEHEPLAHARKLFHV